MIEPPQSATGGEGPRSKPGSTLEDALWMAGALLLTLPWMAMRLVGVHPGVIYVVVLAGLSIVGAAFVLSWGAEMAQLVISPALATIFIALVAVLPEYAVDLYYAWTAGRAMQTWAPGTPAPIELGLPMANMTGANRLLIGLGWSMVVLLYCWRSRQVELVLGDAISLEFSYLLVATLYAFVIPMKGTLTLVDGTVYVGLFLLYLRQALRAEVREIELAGPAARLALMPARQRLVLNVGMFLFAGLAIYLAAQPFAEGLKQVGRLYHIETFLLVQWLAPLASESPEFLVAAIFALRGAAAMGMGALISSKVNQWTLLVGMIPLAIFASSGGHMSMPLDARQNEELLLTAAQSAFAVAVMGNLRMSLSEAAILAALFLVQLVLPGTTMRLSISALYLVLAVVIWARHPRDLRITLAAVRRHLWG